MATVVLENLSKTYLHPSGSAVTVVHGINLEIRDREFMVLVGPSGCGKSTTLRMIAGLEEISGGCIRIDGRVVNDVPPKDRDIAMVFQNYALYPHMSVYENMAFGLRLRKLPQSEIDTRVREAAALLGLEPYLERRPKALSGGQRQRVAVGRAIVRKPKVFLFDEPLSNLDAKMRVSTRAELSKLHARLGATMIYVTHDQVEAMTMGDRICVMKDGRIMQTDTPRSIYHQPRNVFVAGFVGSPPMNFLRGRLERQADGRMNFRQAGEAGGCSFPLTGRLRPAAESRAGREVLLGVRPENIRVHETADANGPACAARVELLEMLGAEALAHLSAGAGTVVARIPSRAAFKTGDHVHLSFSEDDTHLFDPDTETEIISA